MELYELTVHELMDKLDKNEITSEDITKSYVSRINEKEDDIEAFVTVLSEDAENKAKEIDQKIENSMKKMKAASLLGIILFVGIPLPTTGTWTAAAIASILRMRIVEAFAGVFIGNCLSGIIVSLISYHII